MPNDYALERADPSIPQCAESKLSLRFNGNQLILQGGVKPYFYPALSGRAGKYEPIPKGNYWINPDQLWHCSVFKEMALRLGGSNCNSSGWGTYRITIHPFPTTDTRGRGGFFIHGGTHTGSAGCINLGLRVDEFVRDLKSELGGSEHCYLPLLVS